MRILEEIIEDNEEGHVEAYKEQEKIPNHRAEILFTLTFGLISPFLILILRGARLTGYYGEFYDEIFSLIIISFILGIYARKLSWITFYTYLYTLIIIPVYWIGYDYLEMEMDVSYINNRIGLGFYFIKFIILWVVICLPSGFIGVLINKKKS